MGHKNPDRVSIQARRGRCETVGQMIAQRWDVISVCGKCGLSMQAELRAIVAVKGESYSLWNRRPRCRRLFCSGRVTFHAKAPGMAHHEALTTDDREPPP